MPKLKAKKDKEEKYVSQWFWDTDWQGKKYKAFYHGPRLKWMKLFKDESRNNTKSKKTNRTTKHIS